MAKPSVHSSDPRLHSRGFTLIELMIAVVIVGILGSIAYPAYMNSVRKGRRSEAVGALTALQQSQERWRASHTSYSGALTDLGGTATTANGYYGVAIESSDATGYVLAATAAGSQANDTNCTKMRLQIAGGNIFYGGCSNCGAPATGSTVSDTANRCWAR